MQTALRSRLLANSGVSTKVGNRVDWGIRQQGKPLPAIVLKVVSDGREYTMAGADGTQQYRVQVDCYASTYGAAYELGEAVIACLEPASGSFQGSFVIGDTDLPAFDDTTLVHCRVLDFKITHSA